jgi:nicotinamide-nucleotide amidase
MAGSAPYRGADEILRKKAASIVAAARALNLTLVTAESCTAGRVAATLAEAPNASDVVHGGFVTYTEACKEALGVPAGTIKKYTSVSEEVAREMAAAALERSPADVSVSVTGVAGPTKDDDKNPVGLVYLAASRRGRPSEVVKKEFGELDRDSMLFNTVEEALDLLDRMIEPERTNGK